MDERHAEHLTPGARVAVYMGAAVTELTGAPPVVTTATVALAPEDGALWLDVDIARDETLPQRYRVTEVIGFLLPMAVVQREGNVTTATFPAGPVAP